MSHSLDKSDIQNFWGALYESLYDKVDADLSADDLSMGLDALEDMFRFRRHMAVVEMPLEAIAGKHILEVGSGAGGHSALFAKYGAQVTSIDLTLPRVKSTQNKFDLLCPSSDDCRALQSDAENLPFADDSFDLVYSNGVIHHTLDTEKALSEIHRVLKPGGRAVIMLYCKSSWHYWINMFLAVGILKGRLFSDPNWLGKATEWGGSDTQSVENPITRCYTANQIRTMFNAFTSVTLRKGEFYFYLIPILGKYYRRYQIKKYGQHPGGLLVYGEPWPIQSPLELKLGSLIGFAWFIGAEKRLPND